MQEGLHETSKFHFIGNSLALDFVNTRIRANEKPIELLDSFEDLVAWAVSANLIPGNEAKKSFSAWVKAVENENVLAEAIAFRSFLSGLFSGAMNGKRVGRSEIDAINKILLHKKGYSEIAITTEGIEKIFKPDRSDPKQILTAVAESMADFLCFGDPKLVRKCENSECVLLFYDTSKNHKRRWCSMSACGNRAKAAAFYKRQKK